MKCCGSTCVHSHRDTFSIPVFHKRLISGRRDKETGIASSGVDLRLYVCIVTVSRTCNCPLPVCLEAKKGGRSVGVYFFFIVAMNSCIGIAGRLLI